MDRARACELIQRATAKVLGAPIELDDAGEWAEELFENAEPDA